jgi:hypothetical protein
MAEAEVSTGRKRVRLLVRVIALAVALNVLAWVAASWRPDAHGSWALVALPGFFLLGFIVGRCWALLVTLGYGVVHAIPVYLGLLPGYLSTWGEALWWAFALVILLGLTGLGVLCRGVIRWLRGRSATEAAEPLSWPTDLNENENPGAG